MIAFKHRFHRRKDVQHVQKNGDNFRYGAMSLRRLPKHKDNYRVAVVVSKKVDKRAAVRNRIRRRIFELIRKQGRLNEDYDLVVGVYENKYATMKPEKISAEVDGLLKKAQLL
jgi:ribonuclease P protein component